MSANRRLGATIGPDSAWDRSLLDELMTAKQLAMRLGMATSTVEDYARRGVLPSVKVGRHRRFIRSDVERAIATLASASRRV